MNTWEMLIKTLQWERISSEERLELSKWLVAENVEQILSKKILIAQQGWSKKVDITLRASECLDTNENIHNFLWLLGCRKISVTSDFPWYNESYEWSTRIKFKI